MTQRIELVFPKDFTKLAGNKYGKKIYQTQVKGVISFTGQIVFVIPSQIDRAASSFVQGFFDDIIKAIGIDGIESQINFETEIPNFKQFVLDNLE